MREIGKTARPNIEQMDRRAVEQRCVDLRNTRPGVVAEKLREAIAFRETEAVGDVAQVPVLPLLPLLHLQSLATVPKMLSSSSRPPEP